MATITGGYTPGRAWGEHSGFGDIGTKGGGGYGGRGGPGRMWGFLKRQQDMRDRMAEAQLNLIEEQIRASKDESAMRRWKELKRNKTAEERMLDFTDWAAQQQHSQGGLPDFTYRAMQRAQGAGDAMTKAAMLRGISTGGGHGDMSQRGPGAAYEQQMLEAQERGGGAMGGVYGFGGAGKYGMAPGTYAPDVNLSIFGGPAPIHDVPQAGPGMEIGPGSKFTNKDLDFYGGAQLPNIGQAISPYLSPGLQPLEEGTLPGTVQETGPAIVHENEAIIPAEQVDRPLLEFLRRDAMRKGVPLGKGRPTGGTLKYQQGTLKQRQPQQMSAQPTQPIGPPQQQQVMQRGQGQRQFPMQQQPMQQQPQGMQIRPGYLPQGYDPTGGMAAQQRPMPQQPMPQRQFPMQQPQQQWQLPQQWQQQPGMMQQRMMQGAPQQQMLGVGYGGQRPMMGYAEGSLGQGGWGDFWKVVGEAKEEANRLEAAKRGIRGMQVSPKPVPRPKAPTTAAPWSTYGGPGGMSKSAMAKVAKKELGDDAIKALGKTNKGKALLATLGIAGGVAAAAGDVEPLDWKEMLMFALNPPVAIGHAAMQDMMGAAAQGEEPPGMGMALGQAAREQVGGMGAAYAPQVGGFIRGLVPGMGEGAPPTEEAAGPMPATGIEEPAGPPAEAGPPAGTLEAALGRTGAGDFGTPEEPLTLEGEAEPAYPEGYEDLRSLPENITARHKAGMNQVQAEKLLDHLQFHGHELPPEQYQMVMDQAKQKMTLAQMYGKQTQDREKFMQQTAMVGAELQKKLQEIITRETTKGTEQRTTQQQKYDRLERLSTIRQGAMGLRTIIDNALNNPSARSRTDNMTIIATLLQEAAQFSGDAQLDERDALERAEMIVNAPKEQQEFAIITLQDILQQMVK